MKKKRATKRAPRIDVHSHVIPKEMLDAIGRDPQRIRSRWSGACAAFRRRIASASFRARRAACWNPSGGA